MKNYNKRVNILQKPLVTEKTTNQASLGKYSFKVAKFANKIEVKKAIEAAFDVEVTAVNISVVKGKAKKRGNKIAKKPDWKKAIVSLKDGDEINIFEGL
ncbi:MAG: 50S ribosomal protein L23 [Dehalococcoidia bacterium]|jgi:large subunit ribosomal protein L23|nr:50S ribosomal protein L23 [Dehalococcoidia bacterium]